MTACGVSAPIISTSIRSTAGIMGRRSQIMADTMEALDMAFPKPSVDLAEIRRKYHAAVAEGRERKR